MSTSKPKRTRRPKLAALFLLGTDGEMYAACPWPEGVKSLPAGTAGLLAVRLDKTERGLMLDTIHTEGVVSAAKTLAGILRRAFSALKRAVAANVRRLRLDNDLTRYALAKRAKLHPRHVGKIEEGDVNLTISTMVKLARALRCDV